MPGHPGSRQQDFQGGRIYNGGPAQAAFYVIELFVDAIDRLDFTVDFGVPTTDPVEQSKPLLPRVWQRFGRAIGSAVFVSSRWRRFRWRPATRHTNSGSRRRISTVPSAPGWPRRTSQRGCRRCGGRSTACCSTGGIPRKRWRCGSSLRHVRLSIPVANNVALFASVAKTLEGENTHDGTTVSFGTSWGFQARGSGQTRIRFPE